MKNAPLVEAYFSLNVVDVGGEVALVAELCIIACTQKQVVQRYARRAHSGLRHPYSKRVCVNVKIIYS